MELEDKIISALTFVSRKNDLGFFVTKNRDEYIEMDRSISEMCDHPSDLFISGDYIIAVVRMSRIWEALSKSLINMKELQYRTKWIEYPGKKIINIHLRDIGEMHIMFNMESKQHSVFVENVDENKVLIVSKKKICNVRDFMNAEKDRLAFCVSIERKKI